MPDACLHAPFFVLTHELSSLMLVFSFAGVVLIARPEFLFGRNAQDVESSGGDEGRGVTPAQRIAAVGCVWCPLAFHSFQLTLPFSELRFSESWGPPWCVRYCSSCCLRSLLWASTYLLPSYRHYNSCYRQAHTPYA